MDSKWSLITDHRNRLSVERGDLTGLRETLDAQGRAFRCACISVHDTFEEANAAKRRAEIDQLADEHEAATYEDRGEAAYGRPD